MIGLKSSSGGHLGLKNYAKGLLGVGKKVAGMLDSPIASGVVSLVAPEFGAGLEAVRKTGVLEKIKNA
jgi:chorismate synthase